MAKSRPHVQVNVKGRRMLPIQVTITYEPYTVKSEPEYTAVGRKHNSGDEDRGLMQIVSYFSSFSCVTVFLVLHVCHVATFVFDAHCVTVLSDTWFAGAICATVWCV
jgi:hypothetical protein